MPCRGCMRRQGATLPRRSQYASGRGRARPPVMVVLRSLPDFLQPIMRHGRVVKRSPCRGIAPRVIASTTSNSSKRPRTDRALAMATRGLRGSAPCAPTPPRRRGRWLADSSSPSPAKPASCRAETRRRARGPRPLAPEPFARRLFVSNSSPWTRPARSRSAFRLRRAGDPRRARPALLAVLLAAGADVNCAATGNGPYTCRHADEERRATPAQCAR